MPRRKAAVKRERTPDYKYKDILAGQFVNLPDAQGKKSGAEKIFYDALDILAQKSGQPGLSVVKKAMDNVRPVLEVKPRRVGGATYQVPVEVAPDRGVALALKWIIGYSKRKADIPWLKNWQPSCWLPPRMRVLPLRRGRIPHKMAEANKAFAHFRW